MEPLWGQVSHIWSSVSRKPFYAEQAKGEMTESSPPPPTPMPEGPPRRTAIKQSVLLGARSWRSPSTRGRAAAQTKISISVKVK